MAGNNNSGSKFGFFIIGIVVILFVGLIFFKGPANKNKTPQAIVGRIPASSKIVSEVTSVSQSTLDAVGLGTSSPLPTKISAPALTSNSKPEVFYEGAEYCPFCATERWAMTIALSRFGTFSNLSQTQSSSTDVYPNTPTLSYYQSTYKSNYVSFVPVEIYTNIPTGNGGYTSLDIPTSSEGALVNKYDSAPYVPASSAGSIPFLDFGGKYLISGATYQPTVLQGKTADQIASSLNNPNSNIAQGAVGAANAIIATICKLTNNQPSNVCNSYIMSIEKQF